MITKIIQFSIKNKLIVGLGIIALIIAGIYNVQRLPIDAVPDITDNQVQVITTAPSYGATDIERLVTFPIEMATSNINGIKEIRSFSRFGLSLVTIVFHDGVDLYWARQQVAERLISVQNEIPQDIDAPSLGPITTGLGEIYQYVVRPKPGFESKYDPIQLRTIQDWIVRRQLLGVKGVAEVSSFGGKLKQYHINLSPQKLQSLGLTIDDVYDAVERNNQNVGGSYIERGPTVLYIRSEGLVTDIEGIASIPIRNDKLSVPITVRDIGTVEVGYATRFGAMTYNDQGEVAGAVVMMLKGANSNEVIANVKERIAQIQKTMPEGVVIEPFLDRTKMVNNAINTVKVNLAEGALIVIFILVIFLGNLRAGLIVASVIPLAMLFAIIMMNAFGVSGNLMSLGALDFGLIVDGAVIIVEAVLHYLHSGKFSNYSSHKLTQHKMDEIVGESSSKMMNSAIFGQIIILIVYLPILSLKGIEGKMFGPMAQTVSFALIGAFLLSFTYVPMMTSLFISKKIKTTESLSDRVFHRIAHRYSLLLNKVLDYPKIVLASSLGLFFIAVFILTRLGGEFIPSLEEGDFAVDTRVLTGSNLNTTIDFTQKASHTLIKHFPEVEKVVTKIGSGEVPTDPMPMEASDMMVILKPKKEWTSAKTFPELAEKMGDKLKEIPGITAGFQYPVQMRFNELMTGARQDVVCKIFGEDLDTLAHYAGHLGKLVQKIQGAENVYVEPIGGLPQIIIDFDRMALSQYGIDIQTANRMINSAYAGKAAGKLYDGEKRFDIVLKLDQDLRKNIEDIRQLLIPTKSGTQIPLDQLAKVEVRDGPNQIQREDAKRRIIVGFNVRNRDVQSVVHDVQAAADKSLRLPPGYYISYGGSFENLNEAKDRLLIAVPIALALIFLLLYFAFRSIKLGLLIFATIPLSAIGGILLLAARGMPFSISAGVGFIALFGVAVLNGIVLVSEFRRLQQAGHKDIREVVIHGTNSRLRPVLMTALVASLGFLPMALSNGSGAEVQRPLATVVIGGLLIATLLTLFVLPMLYILISTKKIKFKMKKAKPTAVLLFLMMLGQSAVAQVSMTLDEALAKGLNNNLETKHTEAGYQYFRLQERLPYEFNKTSVGAELGQNNGAYFDNKFTVGQSFVLPQLYQAQRRVYEEMSLVASHKVSLQKMVLSKNIASLYFQMSILNEHITLLDSLLRIHNNFIEKADQRLARGESDLLESESAKAQRDAIQVEKIKTEELYQSAAIMMSYLLQDTTRFTPSIEESSVLNAITTFDPSMHPEYLRAYQEYKSATATIELERKRMLPELNIGYTNQSFRGTGPDDRTYKALDRFHSVSLGIDIPIFNQHQKRRVALAAQEAAVQLLSTEVTLATIKAQYEQWKQSLIKKRAALDLMEQETLQRANHMISTVNLQFEQGNINYLEWVFIMNQTIQIKKDYIMLKDDYLQTLAQAYYYQPK